MYQIDGSGYRTLAGKLGRLVSNKRFALAVVLEELIELLRGFGLAEADTSNEI